MIGLKRLALLKHGAPPRNVLEAALRAKWGGGGASYEKTVGPASILSISDAKAKPAKSLIVGMEPIQDLHGYDSPWPAGGGKNLLNPAFDWTKSSGSGVNIDSSADGTITLSGNAEELNVFDSTRSIPSGTYTFSCFNNSAESKVQIYLIDSQGAVPGNFGLNVANKTATFTSANELTKLRIRALAGFSGTFTFKPMMVSGDTAPDSWAPYSNECPITGRTGVTVERTGVNIFDETPLKSIGTYPNNHGGGYYVTDIYRLFSGTYTATFLGSVSKNLYYRIFIVKADGSQVGKDLVDGTTIKPQTFTIEDGGGIVLGVAGGKSQSYLDDVFANTHFMLVCGSTAPTVYEPYAPTTYPVVFPDSAGTVYAGTVDVVSGVLTVTHGMVDLGMLEWVYQSEYNRFRADFTDAKQTATANDVANIISSMYKPASMNDTRYSIVEKDGVIAVGSVGVDFIYAVNTTYSDASTFKTAMSGVQLCYELAEPIPFSLTPTQIALLKNENVLWSDGDSLTLTYIGTQPAGLHGGGFGGSWTPPADEPEDEEQVPEEEQAEESDPEEVIPDGE